MPWIASNAGQEGSIVVQKVREMKDDEGFNALTDTYENLVNVGVIDWSCCGSTPGDPAHDGERLRAPRRVGGIRRRRRPGGLSQVLLPREASRRLIRRLGRVLGHYGLIVTSLNMAGARPTRSIWSCRIRCRLA